MMFYQRVDPVTYQPNSQNSPGKKLLKKFLTEMVFYSQEEDRTEMTKIF